MSRLHSKAWLRSAGLLILWTVSAAGTSPLFFSKDTLYEKNFDSPGSMDQTYLVNRSDAPIQVNSLDLQGDEKFFPTVSMNFVVEARDGGIRRQDQVFFWKDAKIRWFSRQLVIPARDSIRIFYLNIDRCRLCNGKPAPSLASRQIRIPVVFKSERDTATLTVVGWYQLP